MVSQYSSSSSTTNPYSSQQERRKFKPTPPVPHFNSSLHSVRKLPTKILKMPIAPLPPTPPRVYMVDSSNFKQLVQKLTTAPEFQSPTLKSMALPPLTLSTTMDLQPSPITTAPVSLTCYESMSEKLDIQPWNESNTSTPLGFSQYSPMSHAWSFDQTLDPQPWKQSDNLATPSSPMGFGSQSPLSNPWCSFLFESRREE